MEVQDFTKVLHRSRGFDGAYPESIKNKPKDVNMSPVGLGNTRVLTGGARKCSPDAKREHVLR